ncbi:MAG TPA: hypothetical protein VN970_02185 [Thermoanaerobaculia bacterium]|nr:hypothetical protein [Thermoanaerobaculia bacterium]
MGGQSRTVIGALDGIRDAIQASGHSGGIHQQQLAQGPLEKVLAFNDDDHIVLKGLPAAPYFSSHGKLTDLGGKPLPGSKVETAFPLPPVTPDELEQLLYSWPPEQPKPYDEPPVLGDNTTPPGPSKQFYDFGDGSSIVTVGPSLPKIVRTKGGGAQFWVSSIGVISQGSGKYAGAHGLASYVGSAFFPKWPAKITEAFPLLVKGFDVRVAIFVKLVLKQDQA